MIAKSTVYLLDKHFNYPLPNQYAEIGQAYPSLGGEAVNTSIMLSKLGVAVKLDGIWINENHKDIIFSLLKPYRIDISRLSVKKGNIGCEEIVITDKKSRTVFGNYASFHSGPLQLNFPNETDIKNASWVSIDPYFKDISGQIALLCVKHKKPYVTIDCKYNDYLAQNAEAIIISHELRDQAYPEADYNILFKEYQKKCKGLILFSWGEKNLWYGRQNQTIKKFTPYKVKPIDTTGAGDSFRAGIIYGLMNSWDDERTIEFASAVAANVCLSIPHTLNAPELNEILSFLEKRTTNI